MLTDAFVPLFTYPFKSDIASVRELTELLDGMVTHVTYCGLEIDIPDLADRWGSRLIALPQMIAEVEDRSRRDAAELLQETMRFDTEVQTHSITIRVPLGGAGLSLANRARNYDFSAMPTLHGSTEHRAVAEDLLFESGRPLILVPEGEDFGTEPVRFAVAWDGSQVSYRAIHEAIPWIAKSREVLIVTASSDKEVPESSTKALEDFFARHDIRANRIDAGTSGEGIGLDLQRASGTHGAEMMVMGAYGHSRFREFLLGGATAGVFAHTIMPVFMSR